MSSRDAVSIFEQAIAPMNPELSELLARYWASLDLRPEQHERLNALSEKAQEGRLTDEEREELEAILHVDSLISVMRLRAERQLGIR